MQTLLIDIQDPVLEDLLKKNSVHFEKKNCMDEASYDLCFVSKNWFFKNKNDLFLNQPLYVLVDHISADELDSIYEYPMADIIRRPLSESYLKKRVFNNKDCNFTMSHLEEAGEIGVFTIDVKHDTSFISPFVSKIFDLPKDRAMHLERLDDFIHPEDKVFVMGLYQKKFLNHLDYSVDYKIISYKKHIKHIRKKVMFFKENGLVTKVFGSFRDITEEVEYQETINELSDRMSLVVEAAEIGIWDYDIISGDLIWDRHMFDLHHLKIDTHILDMNDWMNYISQQDRQEFINRLKQTIDNQNEMEILYTIPRDDHVAYLRATAKVCVENMSPVRLIGVCFDVTERVLKEQKLSSINESLEKRVKERTAELEQAILNRKIAQSRLESSLDVANVGFWEWRVDEDWSYESKQWFKMLGRDKEDYLNSTEFFHGLIHPDDRPRMRKILDEVAEGKRQEIEEEFRLKHLAGHWEWIMARGRIIEYQKDGRAKMVSGVHINITHIKASQRQVNLLHSAVSASPLGVVITDTDGLITYINESFTSMTGYTFEEVHEKTCNVLKSGYHKNDYYDNLWTTITNKSRWKGEFLNKKKNGDLYWEASSISPILNNHGDIIAYVCLKEDVTSHKEKENEILLRNKRLTRQQWMLQHLTRSSDLTQNNRQVGLNLISEAICNALEVSYSYIGFFEEMDTLLTCASAFDGIEKVFVNYETIAHKDFSNYFFDIQSGSLIALSKDQRSKAYKKLERYLENQNVYASLHFPIRLRGQVVGVVRAGHEIDDRPWLSDEISFIRSISDLITIVLESHERINAHNKAEEAAKIKASFLANMSHEIRTPLNAIVGLSHLMTNTELNDKQKKFMDKITHASNHLMVVINDILDFSKAEAGKVHLETIPFSITKVMANLSAMIEKDLEEKKLYLVQDIHDQVPIRLIGDPYRLTQILLNLVSNAIKFTKEGGVTIVVDRVYSDMNNEEIVMLQFTVMDTGKGMDDNTMAHLFESFEQGDSSITREYGGSGLGLSICKNLVELFDGHIEVESELNKGSIFTFTINVKIDTNSLDEDEDLIIEDIENDASIVIVDDNEINREILIEMLKPKGHSLIELDSGEKLIDYLKQGHHPEIILIDLNMPNLSGYDTAIEIRSKLRKSDIPIIALTADSESQVRDRIMSSGMNDYLGKPILEKTLIDKINLWMISAKISAIEGLNVNKGLNYTGNNIRLYLSLLEKLISNHQNDLGVEKEETLLLNLHTLKGLLRQIGYDSLSNKMEKIEDSLKIDRLDEVLLENARGEFRTFTRHVRKALKLTDDSESSEVAYDEKQLIHLLNELRSPLKNGLINDIQALQEQLKSLMMPKEILLPYQQLESAIKKYKFDAAQVIISAILDTLGE